LVSTHRYLFTQEGDVLAKNRSDANGTNRATGNRRSSKQATIC